MGKFCCEQLNNVEKNRGNKALMKYERPKMEKDARQKWDLSEKKTAILAGIVFHLWLFLPRYFIRALVEVQNILLTHLKKVWAYWAI